MMNHFIFIILYNKYRDMPINHSILQSVEIILPDLHQNDESAYSLYQMYSFAQIYTLEW